VSVFDRYKYYAASPESSVSHAFVVTLDDSVDLTHVTRALYVGCGGDLRVVMADGATVTFARPCGGLASGAGAPCAGDRDVGDPDHGCHLSSGLVLA
jgi:hypothetical protein